MSGVTDSAGLLARLAAPVPGRRIVAIAGAPGSGKSTLAEELVARSQRRHAGPGGAVPDGRLPL